MRMHVPNTSNVFLILTVSLLLSGCGTASNWITSSGPPHKAHQVTEVTHLASRKEVVSSPRIYKAILAAGVSDQDIQNGSVIVGRVFCCGGAIENDLPAVVYVPSGHQVELGDVVEFRVGKEPDGDGAAVLNTLVKVRHKKGMESGVCQWLPDKPPGLWMRVIYCDWMAHEGWQQRSSYNPEWYKPAD
jgi:hypothetical protein